MMSLGDKHVIWNNKNKLSNCQGKFELAQHVTQCIRILGGITSLRKPGHSRSCLWIKSKLLKPKSSLFVI